MATAPLLSLPDNTYLIPVLIGLPPLLLLGGLVGLHIRQTGGYGRLGTAGFFVAFVGTLLEIGLGMGSMLAGGGPPGPVVGLLLGAANLVGLVGLLLVGIATLRAGILPSPWRALPLAIFLLEFFSNLLPPLIFSSPLSPASFAASFIGFMALRAPQVLIGLGWVLLGYVLWSGMGESEGTARPLGERIS